MLIGRYPGDSYAGGNPWSLLTAVTGEVFYKAGEATLNKIKGRYLDYFKNHQVVKFYESGRHLFEDRILSLWFVLGPKSLLPMGCVKLGEKNCIHLPSVGEQTSN